MTMDNVQKHNNCINVPSSQILDLNYVSVRTDELQHLLYMNTKYNCICFLKRCSLYRY
jgi:hypothetical protein